MDFALHRFLRQIIFVALLCAVAVPSFSQTNLQRFKQLSGPMKRWILRHPFVAKKAFHISQRALAITDSVRTAGTIGTDFNGGKLDAFRHGVWMALLARQMGWRKAIHLGRAYEKGNHKFFLQGKLEEGALQDSIAGIMDLRNNREGAFIGYRNRDASENGIVAIVIYDIQRGRFEMIKKDEAGNALDSKGKIIPKEEWYGKWNNRRHLWQTNSTEGI